VEDLGQQEQTGRAGGAVAVLPSVAEMLGFAARLAAGDGRDLTDAERVDVMRAGEVLKATIEGVQAQVALDFEASQRAEQAKAKVRADRQTRGIALQVGLARRGSHHRGQRWLTLAHRLRDMPETFAALREGRITEHKAQIITRHVECLTPEHRERVDLAIAGDPDWLETLGERELEAEVDKIAQRLDPASFVARAARAVADRRVTTRPAPDTMMCLTVLLPVVQGVGAYAALYTWAMTRLGVGDETRSLHQLMADRVVELLTGQATADQQPIAVEVMINDTTLLGADTEPALVPGYGPIPAAVGMALILAASDDDLATLRRLYTHPEHGRLVAMESRASRFPAMLAALIRKRDQRCRNPWCDAPVRDSDHARARAEGGATSYVNGQGLCEACNIAKEAPGWRARPRPGPAGQQDPHTVETTTPTGHVYTSVAPQVGIVRRPLAMELYVSEDFPVAS
jgi:hypothetical protein